MRKRTKQVFAILSQLTEETGHPPIIRQIAEAIADGSGGDLVSDVFYCLQELVSMELVSVLRKPSEGIYIPLVSEVDWEALTKGDDAHGQALEEA